MDNRNRWLLAAFVLFSTPVLMGVIGTGRTGISMSTTTSWNPGYTTDTNALLGIWMGGATVGGHQYFHSPNGDYQIDGAIAQTGTNARRATTNPMTLASWAFNTPGCQSAPPGTTYTRTGLIYVTAGNNAVPCDANQMPISDIGLISEPGHTNYITASEDFTNASWVKVNAGASALPTVAAITTESPAFTTTGNTITFGTTASAGDRSQLCWSFTAAAQEFAFSVWARATGNTSTNGNFYLEITDDTATSYSALCSVNTGNPQRCSVVTTANQTAATWKACIGPDARAFSGQPTVQSTAGMIEAWGASVETIAANYQPYAMLYAPNGGVPGGGTTTFTTPLSSNFPNWCISVIAQPRGGRSWSANDTNILHSGLSGAANSWEIRPFTDGKIYWDEYDNAAALKRINATHGFAAGSQHRITVCNANGTPKIYFDGVSQAGTISGAGTGIITTHGNFSADSATRTSTFSIGAVQVCRTADGTRCNPNVERMVLMGDSITAGTSPKAVGQDPGYMLGANWPVNYEYLTGRLINNQAIPGWTTGQMLTLWTNTLRGNKEDWVGVMGGTNDLFGSVSAASIWSNLNTIYTNAIADGQRVIAFTIPPANGAAGYTGAMEAARLTVNTNILNACLNNPSTMVCVDTSLGLADPNNTGQYLALYDAGDHIHPSQIGAYRIAQLVASVLP